LFQERSHGRHLSDVHNRYLSQCYVVGKRRQINSVRIAISVIPKQDLALGVELIEFGWSDWTISDHVACASF
jgi:hypothetical protein